MNCPKCGLPVPGNEWASYRRHEDCLPDRPAAATVMFILEPFAHECGLLRRNPLGGRRVDATDRRQRNDHARHES